MMMIGPVRGTSVTAACTSWGTASKDKTQTRVRKRRARMKFQCNTTTAIRMRMFSKTQSTSVGTGKAPRRISSNSTWTLKSLSSPKYDQVQKPRGQTTKLSSRRTAQSVARTVHSTQLIYLWMIAGTIIRDRVSPTEGRSGATSSRHRNSPRSLTLPTRRHSKFVRARQITMAYPVRCRRSKRRLSKAAQRLSIAIKVVRSARDCLIS